MGDDDLEGGCQEGSPRGGKQSQRERCQEKVWEGRGAGGRWRTMQAAGRRESVRNGRTAGKRCERQGNRDHVRSVARRDLTVPKESRTCAENTKNRGGIVNPGTAGQGRRRIVSRKAGTRCNGGE